MRISVPRMPVPTLPRCSSQASPRKRREADALGHPVGHQDALEPDQGAPALARVTAASARPPAGSTRCSTGRGSSTSRLVGDPLQHRGRRREGRHPMLLDHVEYPRRVELLQITNRSPPCSVYSVAKPLVWYIGARTRIVCGRDTGAHISYIGSRVQVAVDRRTVGDDHLRCAGRTAAADAVETRRHDVRELRWIVVVRSRRSSRATTDRGAPSRRPRCAAGRVPSRAGPTAPARVPHRASTTRARRRRTRASWAVGCRRDRRGRSHGYAIRRPPAPLSARPPPR